MSTSPQSHCFLSTEMAKKIIPSHRKLGKKWGRVDSKSRCRCLPYIYRMLQGGRQIGTAVLEHNYWKILKLAANFNMVQFSRPSNLLHSA